MSPRERLRKAFDRGKAVAYYVTHSQQPTFPCIWLDRLGTQRDYNLSEKELAAWRRGYRTQKDRKEY